ncbi:DUF3157 family protein [Hyunsoonleella rubra]|uniref:DUF3157 family protein n=1 Tax=Hyunsoonleella rubra TaxID=1737062 RepID=A0ABW5TB86_9FLAO
MKHCLYILLFLLSVTAISQNNYIVKTEDGRRVLLKADYTWEYIDMQPMTLVDSTEMKDIKPLKPNACGVAEDFEEPQLNSKIQRQLKKGRATIEHIKKKVAKDYECDENDVLLLTAKEKKSYGNYSFCANGKKVFYKRNGNKIIEKGKLL